MISEKRRSALKRMLHGADEAGGGLEARIEAASGGLT